MVDAPEKIWAGEREGSAYWTPVPTAKSFQEYTRSDIAERQIAELRAENERLSRHIQLHAGDTASLNNEVETFRQHWLDAEERETQLRGALRPFADMADYLDSDTEGFADTDKFDLLYQDYLFHHFTVADFRTARAALSGSSASGWRTECATEGCGKPATVYFERGGVGSYYCHDCYMRVQALPATPTATGGR